MLKHLLLSLGVALVSMSAPAVTFTADNVDTANATCRISGIVDHNDLPETLTIPMSMYTQGRVCTVTAIAPGALNDLPGVTSINIPATITQIGEHRTSVMTSDLKNFLNAPDLVSFYVSPTNEVYSHSADGMLLDKKGSTLLRVPTKVKTSANGLLDIPSTIYHFSMYAFIGVTTATSVKFAEISYISGESGLNLMPNLATITFTGSTRSYFVENNVLFSRDGELLSFPPRKMAGNYTIPSTVKIIDRFAFANTIYLTDVTIPKSVTDIRNGAFINSSLRSLTIPSSVNILGTDVCHGCKQLTTITFNNDVTRIPDRFAMDCPGLTTVKYNGTKELDYIFDSAFANCISLTSHPFTAMTVYRDSAFYNTGFTEIVFDNKKISENAGSNGDRVFAGCKRLARLDMSAIDISGEPFTVGGYFAEDCPSLVEVDFPDYTFFEQPGWQTSDPITFGRDNKINKVVISRFIRQGSKPVFSWYSSGVVRPNIYMLLNGSADTEGAATYNLCTGIDGTTVKPIYYYERYAPLAKYVDPNASYYVPGGCIENFDEAVKAGCYVEEMYRFSVYKTPSGHLAVKLKEVYPDMIKLVSLRVNNQVIELNAYGTITTAIPYEYVQEIEMTYTAHGQQLTTTYPPSILAGVDNITVDSDDSDAVYYDLQGRQVNDPVEGTLYLVRRGSKTSKEVYHAK